MTALQDLLAKVEAGSFHATIETRFALAMGGDGWDNLINADKAFNGSLDAACALHEAVLPGHWARLRFSTSPKVNLGYVEEIAEGIAGSLARAWLIAILKALIAQEAGE